MNVTLVYTESGINYSRDFSLLAIKGMSEPDKLRKVGVLHDLLNGGLDEQVLGFRKEITLSFKPNLLPAETRFLAQWFDSETKIVVYGLYISLGVTDKELVSHWLYEMEYGRAFDVPFYDSHIYTAWIDPTGDEDDVILKHNIWIEGTSDSPETFTTNSGKLATDQTGQPFPVFNDSLYSYGIILINGKRSQATMEATNPPTVVGGNLSFNGWYNENAFTPDPDDGKMWCSLYILKEPKI